MYITGHRMSILGHSKSKPMSYRIRATALTNYVRVARETGIDPYTQLSKAGIRRAALLDPTAMISADAWRDLLASSAKEAGVEDFGLRVAESRQLTDLGPLGLAIQGEPTLRKALESLMRYLRLQTETVVMLIEEIDHLVVIRQSLLIEEQGPPLRQSIELVIGGLYRLLKRFLGDQWKPRSICFSHAPPIGPTIHTRVFGMQVLFNQEFDGIVCRASDLEAPLADYDPQLASEVRHHLDTQLAESESEFPEIVRRLVLSLLPSGSSSAENVAQQLNLDRRTVHRKLRQHGESFSSIHNQAREELAMRLVQSGNRSLAELAALMSFCSASSFARWFTSRFGCTVSEWRVRSARRSSSQPRR